MNTDLYPEFPKDKFRVRVQRFSTPWSHNKYATSASLFHAYDRERSFPIVQVYARCNPGDVPSRKIGHQMAIHKLILAAKGMGVIPNE